MASSLHERLKQASSVVLDTHTKEEELIFPFSTVETFLLDHPVLDALSLPPREVHMCVIDLHRKMEATKKEERRSDKPAEVVLRSMCRFCEGGIMEIDAHEGVEVCQYCGVVGESRMNIVPEWVGNPEETRGEKRKHTFGKGWSYRSPDISSEGRTVSSYWADLTHYNAYVHLGAEQLCAVDAVLLEWKGGGHSRNAKVAASLLYFPLVAKFPPAEEVRKRMKLGEGLGEVETIVPPTRFACEKCGSGVYTMKEARMHCRLGGVWRKR